GKLRNGPSFLLHRIVMDAVMVGVALAARSAGTGVNAPEIGGRLRPACRGTQRAFKRAFHHTCLHCTPECAADDGVKFEVSQYRNLVGHGRAPRRGEGASIWSEYAGGRSAIS